MAAAVDHEWKKELPNCSFCPCLRTNLVMATNWKTDRPAFPRHTPFSRRLPLSLAVPPRKMSLDSRGLGGKSKSKTPLLPAYRWGTASSGGETPAVARLYRRSVTNCRSGNKLEWKVDIRKRLAGLNLKPEREAEILDELSGHLQDRYDELRAQGALHELIRVWIPDDD
jgi:hypothetical protein